MTAIQVPRSNSAAQLLLERFAVLQDEIGAIEAQRSAQIASANAVADVAAMPLLAECNLIQDKLQPWWAKAAAELTGGKRKSIELGGCMIGTVAGRESLGIQGNEDEIVKTLEKRSWAGTLLRVKTSLDKRSVLAAIDGAYRKQLAALGLSKVTGEEKFFVKRTEQSGTVAEARS